MPPRDKEEMIRENERNFIESYESPTGPMKWQSTQKRNEIHEQIDKKMAELEESGLTREEILFNEQVSIYSMSDHTLTYVTMIERHPLG